MLSQVHHVGRGGDVAVGQLRDVDQSVLLDADVHESPERRDVRHDARQLHPRAQVVDRVHVGIEREDLQLLPRVEALLVERFEDVRHGRQPHVAVHVPFGPYGFAQGLVCEQLLHGDARIGGHAPGDVV